MSSFNSGNLIRLQNDTYYNLVSADADANGNGILDRPGEYADLEPFIAETYQALNITNKTLSEFITYEAGGVFGDMYDILRNVKGITVGKVKLDVMNPDHPEQATEVDAVQAVYFDAPVGNDLFVNVPSASAKNTGLQKNANKSVTFQKEKARTHGGVMNEDTANEIIPWLKEEEKTHQYGDLRPVK